MDPETPNNPPAPPPAASPLGTDPPKAPVTSPPVVPPVTESKSAQKTTTSFTQEQIDEIQHKASNYDLIANDPELATKILDHFKAKTGKIGTPPKTPTPPVTPPPEQNEAINSLNARLAETTRFLAAQEIKMFKMEHPDMEEVKDDMAKLVKQYGMPLEEAYRFSKLAKAQVTQKPDKGKPAVPTSETNESAGDNEEPDTTFEEVEKQINDPKATPHMDDAILKAYLAAKKMQVAQ